MKLSSTMLFFAAFIAPLLYGIETATFMLSITLITAGIIMRRSEKRKKRTELLREQEENEKYHLAEHRYMRRTIDRILSRHADALRNEKRRTTRTDAYGVTDPTEWLTKSIPYFMEQVLQQQHRLPVPNPWFPDLAEYIDRAIIITPTAPPQIKKARRA